MLSVDVALRILCLNPLRDAHIAQSFCVLLGAERCVFFPEMGTYGTGNAGEPHQRRIPSSLDLMPYYTSERLDGFAPLFTQRDQPWMSFTLPEGIGGVVLDGLQDASPSFDFATLDAFISIVAERINTSKDIEKTRYESDHDALTGLYNRAAYMRFSWARPALIVMIDMDGLKLINDTHGHEAGDIAIKKVAASLLASCRQTDIVARLGGDEFALAIFSLGQEEALQRITHSLQTSEVSCSIGVCLFPEEAKTIESALHLADSRMYEQKRQRPNRRSA